MPSRRREDDYEENLPRRKRKAVDDDERPRRSRRDDEEQLDEGDEGSPPRKGGKGQGVFLVVGLIVAGVLVVCGGGLAVAVALLNEGDQKGEPQNQQQAQTAKADMTLAAYMVQRPEKPTKITADCKMIDYYNYAYSRSAATHHSVDLASSGPPWGTGHAWVLKDSVAGRLIFEILKDGGKHRLTLELVFQGPDGTPTRPGDEGLAILKVIK